MAEHAPSADIFDVVETQPVLIGGLSALGDAIAYPEDARAECVEGRVYVQFVVDACGAPTDLMVTRSPDERLSAAAVAAVETVRFTPGEHRGRVVKVRYTLPIRFRAGCNTEPTPLDPVKPRAAPPAAPDTTIWESDAVDREPEPVGGLRTLNERVVYPRTLRESRVQGVVSLGFVVAADGTVQDLVVLSSPHRGLSRAALDALRGIDFTPGRKDGRPVSVRMVMPITFRLH